METVDGMLPKWFCGILTLELKPCLLGKVSCLQVFFVQMSVILLGCAHDATTQTDFSSADLHIFTSFTSTTTAM